jgi:enterochelin esterase family protein
MSPRPAPGSAIVIAARGRHYVRVIAAADKALVTFRIADPGRKLAGVRLGQEVGIARDRLDFHRNGQGWELVIDRPPVSRMEYLLELRRIDGSTEIVTDPGNPLEVDGAFGPKSVLEFRSYTAPAWLTAAKEPADSKVIDVPARAIGAPISVRTWAPSGTPDDEPLPLLVVHDGPEYDSLASLTRYLAAGVAGQWLPQLRAALLGPGPRDRWYSANPSYARALRREVIPALSGMVATSARIGMGASLGGLAILHAQCKYPDAFDALFFQSGSFFTTRLDGHEQRFRYYPRVAAFIASVHAGALPGRAVPVGMTCGMIEENLQNNRLMALTLQARGYPTALHEVPDGHNYTAWRDALDPHLTRLLGGLCRPGQP